MITFNQVLKHKRKKKVKKVLSKALLQSPQKKGICTKIYTLTPKKPNSALRRVAKVTLPSSYKTVIAYIPGEKHFLQEYNIVLIRGGKTQDLPGVKYKIIRGVKDLPGVIGRKTSRSKYGVKRFCYV